MESVAALPPPIPPAVRRAQQGDLRAFEDLYRAHVGRVHAVSLRMAGDGATADDLTQEIFVRAWERIGSYRGDAAFGTWLHRLAINVILSDRRATDRRLARVEPTGDADAHGGPAPVPGAAIDLDRALRTLPEQARRVFVLHEVDGLAHEEVAEAMGTTVGTAKSQLHRARDLLRRFLT